MKTIDIAIDDLLDDPGPEAALPAGLQRDLERFFGAPLDGVHVHLDERLPARGVLAMACASTVHMAPQAYEPHSAWGRRLLAHEMAHVLQQRDDWARTCGPVAVVVDDPALEDQAERLAQLWGVVDAAGLAGQRNLAAPRWAAACPAQRPVVVQCVMLHAKDAIRKVDWIGSGYTQNQADKAKKIIEANRGNGVSTCTVTGLDGKKYGHESSGQMDANPTSNSVSVWWSQSFGAPLSGGTKYKPTTSRNSIADGIRVCGLGTHLDEFKGCAAYRMLWRVSSGLADRFHIDGNAIKQMPAPK